MNRMHSDNDNDGDSGSSGGGKSEENKFQTKLNLRVWTFALHIHTSKKKKGCQVDEVSNHHFYFSCLFVSKFVHEFMNIGTNGRLLFQQQQINKIIWCSRLKRSKVWMSKNEYFFSPSSLLLMQYQKQTRNFVQKLFLLMFWWLTYFRWWSY